MSLAKWINPFNRVADIVDQAVVDKDKREELKFELENLKQQVYIAELNTKTVPWMDGVHKLGRQIISLVSMGVGIALVYLDPEIDPLSLAAILAPGGAYNIVKGKGK